MCVFLCVGGEIVSFCPVSGDAPTFLDLAQDSFRRSNTSVAFTTPPAVGIPLLTIHLHHITITLQSMTTIFSCMAAHSIHVYLYISCTLYIVKDPILYIFSHLRTSLSCLLSKKALEILRKQHIFPPFTASCQKKTKHLCARLYLPHLEGDNNKAAASWSKGRREH